MQGAQLMYIFTLTLQILHETMAQDLWTLGGEKSKSHHESHWCRKWMNEKHGARAANAVP